MNEIKMCGIVLCALVVCVVFKNIKTEYSLFVRITISCLVSVVSLLILQPILSFISEISKDTPVYQYIPTLIKALSVAFIVQITADVCNDAQESSLAEKISLFGKVEILIISLPLVKGIFELSKSLIN